MVKVLTKFCRCAVCGEPMTAGEPFAWHEGSRWVASYGRSHTGARQSGAVNKVSAWKPRHAHDCLASKIEAARSQQANDLCALAARLNVPANMIAEMRSMIMEGRA